MSRVIDCPCGHLLHGADDEELFRLARRHVTDHHPDMQRTYDQLRQVIRERARDEVAVARYATRTLGVPRWRTTRWRTT
jgi:hypothetical protein